MITIIQTTQMVWGLFVNGFAVVTYFTTGACRLHLITVYCSVVMYASYFGLFSKLYLESCAAAAKQNRSEPTARSISRRISQAFFDMNEEDFEGSEKESKKVN